MKKLLFILGVFLMFAVGVSCGDDEDESASPDNSQPVVENPDTAKVVNNDTDNTKQDGIYVSELQNFLQSKTDETSVYDVKILDKNPDIYTIRTTLLDFPNVKVNLNLAECVGLTAIPYNAFFSAELEEGKSCKNLYSIIIPESVTRIGDGAFYGCENLTLVTMPKSIMSIEGYAFTFCSKLNAITIPDGVTEIARYTFWGCSSLTSITIPEGVTKIEENAFMDCSSLISIIIPESVTNIDEGAFRNCSSLTSITIPERITIIHGGTFWNCSSLTSITIPKGVTIIQSYAFDGCCSLTSIIIPENVTFINGDSFANCSNLEYLKFEGTTPPEMYNGGICYYKTIYVPQSAVDDYKTTYGWGEYADQIVGY